MDEKNRPVTRAIYNVLAPTCEGRKELLGMYISKSEGANFWLGVLTDLQNRGVQDILIACVDGLKGFPDTIASVFPQTTVQLCIVHSDIAATITVFQRKKHILPRNFRPALQKTFETLDIPEKSSKFAPGKFFGETEKGTQRSSGVRAEQFYKTLIQLKTSLGPGAVRKSCPFLMPKHVEQIAIHDNSISWSR